MAFYTMLMTDSNLTFHRLETYELREDGPTNERSVICSFKTTRFGYLQIGFNEGGLYELSNEPDLNMFRGADERYIESALAIAWRMVFDAPAQTDRFK